MEVVKRVFNISREMNKATLSITVDENCNVPDKNPDIETILSENAEIENVNIKGESGRGLVGATLKYDVLYLSRDEEQKLSSIVGEISIREYVNIDEYKPDELLQCRITIDDICVKTVNSRKINIRAIIVIEVTSEDIKSYEAITDVQDDVKKLTSNIRVSEPAVRKKERVSIREEYNLIQGNPDIESIVFKDVRLMKRDVRLIEDGCIIRGEISVFIIYMSKENKDIIWTDNIVSFDETLSLSSITPDMTEHINERLASYTLKVRPDESGRERKLCLEAILELDIKVYNDCEHTALADVYNPLKEYVCSRGDARFEKIIVRNESKCQLNENVHFDNSFESLLQICNVSGEVKTDDVEIVENGINVRGVLAVNALAVMADDNIPFSSIKGQIPFCHLVEAPGITEGAVFDYYPYIEKLSATLTGDCNVSIRGDITFSTLVKENVSVEVITEIEEQEADMEAILNMPGITGYIVKEGDTLWNISKTFKTTPEQIMAINQKTENDIRKGEKLIIIKNITNS